MVDHPDNAVGTADGIDIGRVASRSFFFDEMAFLPCQLHEWFSASM
jgi:hypothetical protein